MSDLDSDREVEELRRCLRDVLGLLALPAIWRARSPAEIAASLLEALDSTVAADVLACSARFEEGAPVEVARVAGKVADPSEVLAWFGSLTAGPSSAIGTVSCGARGPHQALFEPLAFRAARGYVLVASRREDFPSRSEVATIRAATALATTSLETSRALIEREAALRAKDDFLAVLGHELRNPLAPIVAALDVMAMRGAGPVTREEEVIRTHVTHLGRLVDDLLDLARISRGSLELKRTPVELSEPIEHAVGAAAPLLERRRQTLQVRVPERGLVLDGDVFRLTQVFLNLLANAAKYSPEGSRIDLEAVGRDGRAIVTVRDEGVGMSPELLARIFEPFVQGRVASDAQYGGLGVGLALVRTLVAMHGGAVRASSEGAGRGSSFEVELPLATAHRITAPTAADEGSALGRPLRLLIVDDNADAAEMLGEALGMVGHQVRVVDDPRRAVDAAAEVSADVVVLDLGMPLLDGFAVAARLKERFGEDAPAMIALTGYGQPGDRDRTRAAGFGAHLVKPVALEVLIATIAGLVGR